MEPRTLIDIMRTTGKLKDMTRHSWTAAGRRESVAEHTYQMMIMAYFIQDEFPEADMKKVMEMCLFHDMGEAFTGDIPAFEKKPEHEAIEKQQVQNWICSLPEGYREKVAALFNEMEALETLESRIYKALDKLEVVIQHNEADLSTWLPLEYTLNLEYGDLYMQFSRFMKEVRRLAKEDSEEKIRRERPEDIQLHYTEKGHGKPLILLHGNGESSDYFQYQIPYFSRKYRVIAIDTRGHGKSPRGTAPFTISQFADDLYDFMKLHRIEKAHILGFSDGGNIALIFALRHPEMVDRLILNGANLCPSGVKLRAQIPIVLEYYVTALPAHWQKKTRKRRAFLKLMVKEPHISPKELGKLQVPVLVIAGTRDMIRGRHTRRIAKCLPMAQLRILLGDHFIARRSPDRFNRTVAAFLSGKPE